MRLAKSELVCAAVLLTSGTSVLTGQFSELATTDDGSTLYFASKIRPKGSNLSLHSKIYRWTARDGVVLVAEEPSEAFDGCQDQFFYQLHTPQVSADGSVTAYTGTRPVGGKFCPPAEPNEAVISFGGARSLKLPGSVALSRNGRYAVTVPSDARLNNYHVVTDLTNGQTWLVDGAFNGSASRITDAGAVISPEKTAIVLAERDGSTRVLRTQEPVGDAAIDPTGRTIVYITPIRPSNAARIAALDVLSGRETELDTSIGFAFVSITADGATVYYIVYTSSGRQLFATDIAGTNRRQVVEIQDGLADEVASGDGRVVFGTSAARLLRVDTVSGAVTEILPATPDITVAYRGGLAPQTTVAPVGSVMALWGSGVAKEASICGSPVALINTRTILPPQVRFQVPWDLAEGPCVTVVRTDSPFESGILLEVREYDPQFLYNGNSLYHENFAGIVSPSQPAQVGEVIAFYMTGLGPVDAAGMVGGGFACSLNSITTELLYAGLAPGALGFYQVNLRVPAIDPGAGSLVCGFSAELQARATLSVGPTP